MSTFRLAALALLVAPFTSLAQPAPGEAPVEQAAAVTAPADPFTQRGQALADTVLRGGPDGLAEARATVPAGMTFAMVPGIVRGFVRVRVATGESGYVSASDVTLGEGAPPPPAAGYAPAASPAPAAPLAPARALAPPPPPRGDRTRLIARAGFAIPADDFLEGFDPGLSLEVGFVTPLAPSLALELTAGWSRLGAEESGIEARFRSVPLLAGLRLVAPSPGLEVYFVVGGGVSLVALSGGLSGGGSSVSDSATAGVFQIGAGMSMPLSGGSHFELGLRYYGGKAELFEVKGGIDVTTIYAGWAL